MKNYTDITLLVDRSGSMSSCRESMEKGIRTYLEGQSHLPETRVTIIYFDSESIDTNVSNEPINNIRAIRIEPRGGTPLYDALVTGIERTGFRLRNMQEADRPSRVLFITITDGEENASIQHTGADVARIIDQQTKNYNWDFIYLGANQDAILSAKNFGLRAGNSLGYSISPAGVASTFDLLLRKTVDYSTQRTMTVGNFTEEERQDAMKGSA